LKNKRTTRGLAETRKPGPRQLRTVKKPHPPTTDEEIITAAMSDPDCPPSTPEQLAQFRRVPNVKKIREKLGLSQAEFAQRFELDVRAVQDWEQDRRRPDRAAKVLLRVIDADPEGVVHALEKWR
jgi:putative transcriptional regulator